MYVTITVFLVLIFFIMILFHFRKRSVIRKICILSQEEKCFLLNEIVKPLGYCYDSQQDIFSSTRDAWQGDFGYTSLYDRGAPLFNMVFDCQPVCFDYDGRTWLIEFWKGQYGINTGAEIGIYYADSILSPAERNKALFQRVSDEEMLPLRLNLYRDGKPLASLAQIHWWLTIFCTGIFSRPEQLSICLTITFPNREMQKAFSNALMDLGYSSGRIQQIGTTVLFSFCQSPPCKVSHSILQCLIRKIAQMQNRLFCKCFLFITRPFQSTADRLLYLYFYLPFAFRRTLRLHRFHKF